MLHYLYLFCGLFYVSECARNNVCKTIEDYRTLEQNPNCWYNPDVGASPEQLIKRYGYPFESHKVKSEDGYILTVYRIPHNGSDIGRKRTPVFLQHGIFADSSNFLELGPKSLAFVLSNNGYDVWLSNARGSYYSSDHVKYTVYDPIYWKFSFHEMGAFDIPAIVEFITAETGQKGKIIYIGHSMGTTISYVYASVRPQHASKHLRAIISFAPIAYMSNTRSIGRAIAPFRNLIWDLLTSAGIYGLGRNFQFKFDLIHRLCNTYPTIIICTMVSNIAAGSSSRETDYSTLPVISGNLPSGFSLKTILHYGQIIDSNNRFQFFDYGPELNIKLYNSSVPPEYPLSRIKVPVHLFYGRRDPLTVEEDVYNLYNKLETDKSIMEVPSFAHLNFLAAKHANDFYQVLLMYLKKYS